MPKLKIHELLAVQSSLDNQSNVCVSDLKNTFSNKVNHFKKIIKSFTSLSAKEGESIEPKVEEESNITTTVIKEIKWINEKLKSALDVAHQIDIGNQSAKADVIIGGVPIIKDVPATNLLQLEKRLVEIQTLIKAIPTLDPVKGFELDKTQSDGIFKARDSKTNRTQKTKEVLVLYPHSDKHPAQTQVYDKDVIIGELKTQEWSSLITVKMKGDLQDRVEDLIRAVKKARSNANNTEVDVDIHKIGEKVLNYIFEPLLK